MNKLLCVLSTGRSGTSLLANLAEVINFKLSDKLLGSYSSNPKGHFEDLNILHTNDSFLMNIGKNFFTDSQFTEKEINYFNEEFASNIFNYLRYIIGEKKKLVLKEPRISKMFLMYKKIFDKLENEKYYLFLYRNPNSFSKSMIKAYHMVPPENRQVTKELTSKIYFNHTLNILENLNEKDKVLYLNFDHYINDMNLNIKRIANFVDEEIDLNHFLEYTTEFYDKRLVNFQEDELTGYEYADNLYKLLESRMDYTNEQFLREVKRIQFN